MSSSKQALSAAAMRGAIPHILAAMPKAWRGTTFKNHALLSRAGFAAALSALLAAKGRDGALDGLTSAELTAVGNAEDYLRVASNVSSTLELALALAEGPGGAYGIDRVFTFASLTMPFVAVALTTGKPVHVYGTVRAAGAAPLFSAEQLVQLGLVGATIVLKGEDEAPPGEGGSDPDCIVVQARPTLERPEGVPVAGGVDAVVAPNVLFIANPARVDAAKVLVIRKRMATPVTTPVAEALLQGLAGMPVTADQERASEAAVAEFLGHLQTMSGTAVNPAASPVVFTAGLPTLCSLWVALIGRGGADILMCSTAYGGSSQLVDVLGATAPTLRKHTFDIQGTLSIVDSIQAGLNGLAAAKGELTPTTVLFVEIPTNPDMKVPDMPAIAGMVRGYAEATGRDVVVLIDSTFAPASGVMRQIQELLPAVTVLSFISMSKSISRGLTTAGALVGNHTPLAAELIGAVRAAATMLDTTAKPDQVALLAANHGGVEERCRLAYDVARTVGAALQGAVRTHAAGHEMRLAFVTPEQAALGFTSSTFSFNLPPPAGATPEVAAGLAQAFVDLLRQHPALFKPCVSFGQDNGLVYATVPATSTQGAIKEEDKAKQAVGGVQLVRLSFPPTIDVAAVTAVVVDAVAALYPKAG